MLFFIDTANLDQIQEANDMGILDGVTTNPSLMLKEGIGGTQAVMDHYAKICQITDGDVSAEVTALDTENMLKQGRAFAEIAPNIVVKIPMTLDGVKAIAQLTREDIKTNCTLVFSAGQALMCAKAGATYVSPFIGRIDDISWDGIGLIEQINELYGQQAMTTAILAASIRSPKHIVDAAIAGADVVTTPLGPLKKLISHPLTDIGLAKFMADFAKSESGAK
ncbi:MAG: fructose-6-phosphate aldolase [Saprospiraceae bacterium]